MSTAALFFLWYYTQGLSNLVHNVIVTLSGLARFFSFGRLLATLLSPWRRIRDSYHGGVEERLATFTANVATRLFGGVVRLLVAFLGVIATCLVGLISVALIMFWILAPVLIPFLMGLGLRSLLA